MSDNTTVSMPIDEYNRLLSSIEDAKKVSEIHRLDAVHNAGCFERVTKQLAERDAALARCVEALKAAEAAIMDEVCASSGEDHPVINAHAKIAEKARKVLASLPTSAQATAKVEENDSKN